MPWTGEIASAPNEAAARTRLPSKSSMSMSMPPSHGEAPRLSHLQEVAVGQRDQGQTGLDLAHAHERSPVEALDRHPVEQAGLADLARDDLHELFPRRGLLRRRRLDLGLDVEPDLVAL
jgi:hypothetical protein